jgi:sialate O-acetylesterase
MHIDMKYYKNLFVLLFLLTSSVLMADVKLPAQFSDHMVLQRDKPVPVWGWASPAEKISVTFNKQTRTVVAEADGKWMIHLDKLSAGGPLPYLLKEKII